jgi:hypothetical protein
MIKARRFAYIVVFCLIASLGYSESLDSESEYVARCNLYREVKLQA